MRQILSFIFFHSRKQAIEVKPLVLDHILNATGFKMLLLTIVPLCKMFCAMKNLYRNSLHCHLYHKLGKILLLHCNVWNTVYLTMHIYFRKSLDIWSCITKWENSINIALYKIRILYNYSCLHGKPFIFWGERHIKMCRRCSDALPTFLEFSALMFPTVNTCYSLPKGFL